MYITYLTIKFNTTNIIIYKYDCKKSFPTKNQFIFNHYIFIFINLD